MSDKNPVGKIAFAALATTAVQLLASAIVLWARGWEDALTVFIGSCFGIAAAMVALSTYAYFAGRREDRRHRSSPRYYFDSHRKER